MAKMVMMATVDVMTDDDGKKERGRGWGVGMRLVIKERQGGEREGDVRRRAGDNK